MRVRMSPCERECVCASVREMERERERVKDDPIHVQEMTYSN